jgi:predicted transcriptional regulator
MLPYNNNNTNDLKSLGSLKNKSAKYNIRPTKLGEKKRQFLLSIVQQYPGVKYRQALRITGLSNGSLGYNINVLESQNRLKVLYSCKVKSSANFIYLH